MRRGDAGPASQHTIAETRAYFARRAPRYQEGNWQRKGLHEAEKSAVKALPAGLHTAVDLGSGRGDAISLLLTRAKCVYAVDLAPEMLTSQADRATTIIADAHELPIAAGGVDLVFARMSIHYMDLERLKVEMLRVLSLAGFLIVASAFPYTADDEDWFNARHKIKQKPYAHTPTIPALVALLAPEFALVGQGEWTERSLGSRTVASHDGDAWASELRAHAESAPPAIQRLYRVRTLSDGDLEMVFRWAVLTFQRTQQSGV
jgi:ubiquinone/menaquinone biosynthesis C-methylase UbiE